MPDSGFVLPPAFRVVTDAIAAVNGGSIEFYAAGTSTPLTVYSNSGLSSSLGSTVYLDSGGHPVASQGSSTKVVIYTGAALVKLIVKDGSGTTLATYDNVKCTEDTSGLDGGAGSGIRGVRSKTANYTVISTDNGYWLDCDPTSGSFTVTLPDATATGIGDGFSIGIRHAGTTTSNPVLFKTSADQTIAMDGATATGNGLVGGGEALWLVCNGAGWRVISHLAPRMTWQAMIQVTDRLTAPPTSPTVGNFYIINGTPTGEWASYAQHDLVQANGQGGWIKHTPPTNCGWWAYIRDEQLLTQFRASAWVDCANITAPSDSTLGVATFQDQKANGTAGGTNVADAWTARALNTEVVNTISGCSLASNQITLPASKTFFVSISNTFGEVAGVNCRFKSTTTAKEILSPNFISEAGTNTIAAFSGIVTLTSSEVFELQYLADTAQASTGLGSAQPSTTSNTEVYASVTIVDLTAQQGPQGAQGPQGPQGSPGNDGGIGYWNWETSTSATPSSGAIRFNNATFASVTQIYLSETDGSSRNLASLLATIDDSTSTTKGYIRCHETATPTNFWFGTLSSLTDNGTDLTLAVTHLSSSGSFSSGDDIIVEIIPKGDKGDTGAAGSAGSTGATGATGPNAGLDYAFNTATSGDPGSGKVLFNNATIASVTQVNISETGRNSEALANVIATWNDSTNTTHYGHLRIFSTSDRTKFIELEITGTITDAGSYRTIPVSYTAGGTLPANNDVMSVMFERTGNKGADGAGTGDVVGPASATDNAVARFDGTTGKFVQNSAVTIDDTTGRIVGARFGNTGLRIEDTNASHLLTFAAGSDLTADRTLTITTGDASRTLTLTGNATVNQDVSSAGSPAFVNINLTNGLMWKGNLPTSSDPGIYNSTSSQWTRFVTNGGNFAWFSDSAVGNNYAGSSSIMALTSAGVLTIGTIDIGSNSDTTLSRASAGELAVEGSIVKKVGKETIFIPAGAMTARTTNGAASGTTELATNDIMLRSLDFDTTTEEGAGFMVAMPKSWNESTVTFKAFWTAASGSGGVAWGLAAYALSDDDAMDTAVSGQQIVTDTLLTANDMHTTAESSAITIGGTPAEGDVVYFEITREVANGSDTLGVDAKLLGIHLYITTNASTDA